MALCNLELECESKGQCIDFQVSNPCNAQTAQTSEQPNTLSAVNPHDFEQAWWFGKGVQTNAQAKLPRPIKVHPLSLSSQPSLTSAELDTRGSLSGSRGFLDTQEAEHWPPSLPLTPRPASKRTNKHLKSHPVDLSPENASGCGSHSLACTLRRVPSIAAAVRSPHRIPPAESAFAPMATAAHADAAEDDEEAADERGWSNIASWFDVSNGMGDEVFSMDLDNPKDES
jgi:hypothetical protein